MRSRYALLAYGFAFRTPIPRAARDALRRGLVIAKTAVTAAIESHLGAHFGPAWRPDHGDPLAALDYLTLAIRNYHDAGNVAFMRTPLASLAALLRPAQDASRQRPPSPGSRYSPMTSVAVFPELMHLRSLTSAKSSVTRPTNRSPAQAKR